MDNYLPGLKRQTRAYHIVLTVLFLFAILTPSNDVQASLPGSGNEILQLTAAGHVLGFKPDAVYFASGNHMLKIGFVGTSGSTPTTSETAADDSNIQLLTRVSYSDLWPGIDLVYATTADGIVESTWQIAPGFAPEQIQLRYNAPVEIDGGGNLKIRYQTGWMRESAPIAWQQINGRRRPVQVAFNIVETVNGESVVTFDLGQYNPNQPLLIDPVLEWNTFVGSTGYEEGYAMAVDSSGNVYITGLSTATWGTPKNAFAGGGLDAFVAKLNSSGVLQWHTFLGSSGFDKGFGIAVDGSSNVYVTGYSATSWGSPLVSHGGAIEDAFIAKLNSTGDLQWNTFLGSSGTAEGKAIASDSSGNTFITGFAGSSGFAIRLDTAGTRQWTKSLGSAGSKGLGIALDSSNNVYLTGESVTTWGTTPLEAHPGNGSWNAVFVAKLNSAGTLQWNTFMGSTSPDISGGIAVDSTGTNIYITGTSYAAWGATPVNAYAAGGINAFVTRLNTNGTRNWHTFINSTSLNSFNNVWGEDIALDDTGNPHLGGFTNAAATGSVTNAYAAKMSSAGALLWSSLMGSTSTNEGKAIALDSSNNIYLAGHSDATWGSPIVAQAGSRDAFVAKFCATCFAVDTSAPASEGSFTPTLQAVISGETTTFDVTAEPGYTINTVSGCYGSNWTGVNPYTTDAITSDCTVTATFTINTYTLTYSAGTGGSITGTLSQLVDHGNDGSTVTADPGIGYSFVKWSDDVFTATRTDTNVSGNITVEAQFAINTYTLTYSAGTGGSVTGTLSQLVDHGNDGSTVTAESDPGYHFVKWSDDVFTATRTDTNVSGNITVEAQFAINTYTLTYNHGTGGTISGDTSQTVNYNNDGSAVTAVPNTGYHFVKWDDNVSAATRTDTNVTTDITVTAEFAINTYTLTYTAGANGYISGKIPPYVNHGTDGPTVTAIADTGYHFSRWSDHVTDNPRTDTYITADISVTAIFKSDFTWNLFLPAIITNSVK